MRPIGITGFEHKFAVEDDPWRTFSDRDERLKRDAIVRALGPATRGRILELGAGNGSNSVALATRALRLDATEATANGSRLVARALGSSRRTRAIRLAVPAHFPRREYDAVVIAELLYYLDQAALETTARAVASVLTEGGAMILAHHRIDFDDFAQHAAGIHSRFLSATRRDWHIRIARATRRWRVMACRLRPR